MSYRNDRFNQSMKALGLKADLSDNGQGVERMLDEIEPPQDDSLDPDQAIAGAILRLIVAEKEYLVETLLLIYENRNDRQEIIHEIAKANKTTKKAWHAAEMRYFRHRKLLLDFFM